MLSKQELIDHACRNLAPDQEQALRDLMEEHDWATMVIGPSIVDDLAEAEEMELDLRKQEAQIKEDISKIKLQLKRRKIVTEADKQWRNKAHSALKIKGAQHQDIMSRIRTCNSSIMEFRRRAHVDHAVKAAKEIMTKEQWERYIKLLNEKYETA